jgi:hypothetical protein
MELKLNTDQELILSKLKDFVLDESSSKINKFFLLTGEAGTGKTFIVTYLLSLPELSNKKIAVTGCTNKAVGVLESSFYKNLNIDKPQDPNTKSNLTFVTIHKLLQIKRKIDANGDEVFESIIDENNIKVKSKSIFHYNIIIVDEVSMLNKDMTLQLLRLQNKITGKIIFLGDKAQLPPVKESESHIFELADTKIPHSKLSKIMRSGDQIINFVNSIRRLIDDPSHKVPFKKLATCMNDNDVSRITLFRNEEEWIQKYLDNNQQTDQIILCYTNRRVDLLNRKIRKSLFKTDQNNYVSGEKIIFNNTYRLSTNQFKYDSSQMMKIKSSSSDSIQIRLFNRYDIINPRFPIYAIDTKSVELKKKLKIPDYASDAYKIENNLSGFKLPMTNCHICYEYDYKKESKLVFGRCKHQYCEKCYDYWELKMLNSFCPLCVLSISDEKITVKDDLDLTRMISNLRNTSSENNKFKIWLIVLDNNDLLYVVHNEDKERYDNTIENLKKQLRDINNYIITRYTLKNSFWQKIIVQLWEFYYYYYIDQFAQINYGNAITTHRSQGSTYKRVYVDLIDIIKCNDIKKEGFQCLYTAVTRASDNLEILF